MSTLIAFVHVLFWLLVAHAVTDYALQPGEMSQYKRRPLPIDRKASSAHIPAWFPVLAAHALINAGGVALATSSVSLGMAEGVAHFCIDYNKSQGRLSDTTDQVLHGLSKLLWAALYMFSAL